MEERQRKRADEKRRTARHDMRRIEFLSLVLPPIDAPPLQPRTLGFDGMPWIRLCGRLACARLAGVFHIFIGGQD